MLTNQDTVRYYMIFKNDHPASGVLTESEAYVYKSTRFAIEEQSQLRLVPVTADGRVILHG